MSELTLTPSVAAIPGGDKQIVVPVVATVPGLRRRGELRARRRFNSRVLQANDAGFRLFRIY